MERYQLGEQTSSVTGVNKRYPGVTHKRTLDYHKANNTIVVSDRIDANDTHNYKILWHLAPSLEPEIDGNKVTVRRRDGKTILKLNVSSSVDMNVYSVYGEEHPIYKGLYFDKRDQPLNTHVLIIDVNASNAEIVTTFELNPPVK